MASAKWAMQGYPAMTADIMTIADYRFRIARAEITGTLRVDAEDGTNLLKPSGYELSWDIEVRAEEYPLTDEAGEMIEMIEPVFSHQSPAVDIRDWRDWAGQTIVHDENNGEDPGEVPILAIGGGDRLAVSTLAIGERRGATFPFEWSGTCRPAIDERSGLDPFHMAGTIAVSTITVIFNEEDGEPEEVATRLLQAHCPMPSLHLRAIRQPYATWTDGPERLRRLMHATFAIVPVA